MTFLATEMEYTGFWYMVLYFTGFFSAFPLACAYYESAGFFGRVFSPLFSWVRSKISCI